MMKNEFSLFFYIANPFLPLFALSWKNAIRNISLDLVSASLGGRQKDRKREKWINGDEEMTFFLVQLTPPD